MGPLASLVLTSLQNEQLAQDPPISASRCQEVNSPAATKQKAELALCYVIWRVKTGLSSETHTRLAVTLQLTTARSLPVKAGSHPASLKRQAPGCCSFYGAQNGRTLSQESLPRAGARARGADLRPTEGPDTFHQGVQINASWKNI